MYFYDTDIVIWYHLQVRPAISSLSGRLQKILALPSGSTRFDRLDAFQQMVIVILFWWAFLHIVKRLYEIRSRRMKHRNVQPPPAPTRTMRLAIDYERRRELDDEDVDYETVKSEDDDCETVTGEHDDCETVKNDSFSLSEEEIEVSELPSTGGAGDAYAYDGDIWDLIVRATDGNVAEAKAIFGGYLDFNRRYFKKGLSLFHIACQGNSADLVERLIKENGANVSYLTESGDSPLYLAVCAAAHRADPTDRFEVITALLQAGSPVNSHNVLGYTALHQAAQIGSVELINLLLHHGADPRATTRYGFKPVHVAASARKYAIAHMLENAENTIGVGYTRGV